MKIKIALIIGFTSIIGFDCLAQREMLMYEKGFVFKVGVYSNFQEFKNNQPSITDNYEIKNGRIYTYNDSLNKLELIHSAHWGYTDGKSVFVKIRGGYQLNNTAPCRDCFYTKIGMIGELSHIVIDNVSGANTGAGVAVGGGGAAVGLSIPIGGNSSNSGYQQYILDFVSGGFIPFSRKNFEGIIAERDPALFEEYKRSKQKKSVKATYYLTVYNDLHPIYFPE